MSLEIAYTLAGIGIMLGGFAFIIGLMNIWIAVQSFDEVEWRLKLLESKEQIRQRNLERSEVAKQIRNKLRKRKSKNAQRTKRN